MPTSTPSLSGRRAQAARNDGRILDAARAVFLRDPDAPVAAVAAEARVGVSALYRRYPSKEELLRTLCGDGLRRFVAIADAAWADGDPWNALAAFVSGVVEADVHSLTVRLAGRFTPTPELRELAGTSDRTARRILQRAKAAGAVRPDVQLNDLVMIFEQLSAIRLGDAERTAGLRSRYLALLLDALRPQAATRRLPGHPPTDTELGARWIPRAGRA